MAVTNLIILGLISAIMIYCSPYYILFSIFLNFYIVRRLRVCYTLYWNSKVILTTHKHVPHHLFIEFIISALLISLFCVCYFISLVFDHLRGDLVTGNLLISVITICIWAGIFYTKKLTYPEISYLSSVNNLTYGYGGAIWYYKNYLSRILPEKFLAGVRQFETDERVSLPHKLYILCPKSCKVKKYIDYTDNIEHTKDLPAFKIDHGGIKDREYRVSVYGIKNDGVYFRCALEYAQPLKTLLTLKERGKISLTEMDIERETFIKNLSQMLRDRENSFEVCELVEYDDEKHEIHVILSSLPSLQKYNAEQRKQRNNSLSSI